MHEADITNTVRYKYKFQFDDGTEREFTASLDSRTLSLLSAPNPKKPEWTKLKYQQCENCPLSSDVEYCPVAVSLSGLVEEFKYST